MDKKLGILSAKFLRFFLNNKLVFVYKNILHSQQASILSKNFKFFLMLDSEI